ncbi:hypothetical protein [Legionella sainthelensi]|uniref:hypothetical protein n=1 Tax=Legionella sainthelensi TaxID=28087 RepID=UPI000EF2F76A|nr:hypothetical protein [Legionella sainthelensi]AYK03139.1 hypothetical protein CAB17_20570 [Legionella sainthelensi]
MQHFNLNMNSLDILSRPIQQLMELNQKALSNFSYIEPQEFTQIRNPQALLEKNMHIFIGNGHASLEYLHQLFNIMEDAWTDIYRETREKAKDVSHPTQSGTSSAIKKSDMKSTTSPTKHASPSSKNKKSRSTSSHHKASGDETSKSKMSTSSSLDEKENTHKA